MAVDHVDLFTGRSNDALAIVVLLATHSSLCLTTSNSMFHYKNESSCLSIKKYCSNDLHSPHPTFINRGCQPASCFLSV